VDGRTRTPPIAAERPKHAITYRGAVVLAAIITWLRT